MNDKSLEKNLANLERELLALQTAHDVGLGAVGFYEYEGDYMTFPSDLGTGIFSVILVDVLDGEREDPVLNVYTSSIYGGNSTGFAQVERVNGTKFDYYDSRLGSTQVQMHYKVVSTSKLKVKACESEQEYLDWLNG